MFPTCDRECITTLSLIMAEDIFRFYGHVLPNGLDVCCCFFFVRSQKNTGKRRAGLLLLLLVMKVRRELFSLDLLTSNVMLSQWKCVHIGYILRAQRQCQQMERGRDTRRERRRVFQIKQEVSGQWNFYRIVLNATKNIIR